MSEEERTLEPMKQVISFTKFNINFRSVCLFLGTALEALSSMQSFLKSRPSSFRSLEEGIEWRYSAV